MQRGLGVNGTSNRTSHECRTYHSHHASPSHFVIVHGAEDPDMAAPSSAMCRTPKGSSADREYSAAKNSAHDATAAMQGVRSRTGSRKTPPHRVACTPRRDRPDRTQRPTRQSRTVGLSRVEIQSDGNDIPGVRTRSADRDTRNADSCAGPDFVREHRDTSTRSPELFADFRSKSCNAAAWWFARQAHATSRAAPPRWMKRPRPRRRYGIGTPPTTAFTHGNYRTTVNSERTARGPWRTTAK